jgi:ribosomal protein S18 acetylase RimI-like enzyme
MVAETVRESTTSFRGLRPFVPSRDLGGVAMLLEKAFREDLTFLQFWSRVPLLRNVSAYLWAASFAPAMPESLVGFVWEEDRRIVGNVTVTPDESQRRHWLVSNVAVDEEFRRRGIARQLMEAATAEARGRGADWLILNVRPHNSAAITLYENLGFETIDTEMAYIRRRQDRAYSTPIAMRKLNAKDNRAAYDLARSGIADRMKMFRPPRSSEFGVHLEDRLSEGVVDFFIGQATERWGLFEGSILKGTVLVRAQRIGSPHTLDIHVAPAARGLPEAGMVAFALSRLTGFPRRDISIRVLTSHRELVDALIRERFVPTRGLTLMAKEL